VLVGGVPVDGVTLEEALDEVGALVNRGDGGAVFTPNVDHVVLAQGNARMRDAYGRASLSLADGMPIVLASRVLGRPLPAKVSGADFVPILLERAAQRGWRVYFLGGSPGVAARARERLRETLPQLQVVGVEAPQIDIDEPAERHDALVARIAATRPHLVLVALGAPKQEIWTDRARDALRPAVLLGIGGTLDFIAGIVPRAPRWMSNSGLEWLFRFAIEPRRLWYRYLVRDPQFLLIVGRALRSRPGANRRQL
jgi:N-acetylglucosaminyldiphosphoundecaprenol N-acetyl-beta-D-mannosaminyltransferase